MITVINHIEIGAKKSPWSAERESQAFQFLGTPWGKKAVTTLKIGSMEDGYGASDLQWDGAYPELLYYTFAENEYRKEVRAYERLHSLQAQGQVPRLMATVSFQTRKMTEPLLQKYCTVHGFTME